MPSSFLPWNTAFPSMESIDKIGQHEKFLAKNFESLDVEDDPNEGTGESPNGKNRYCEPCWY